MEGCQSGRRQSVRSCRLTNRQTGGIARLFLSPKNKSQCYFSGTPAHSTFRFISQIVEYAFVLTYIPWKGVRVVECARLESGCA